MSAIDRDERKAGDYIRGQEQEHQRLDQMSFQHRSATVKRHPFARGALATSNSHFERP